MRICKTLQGYLPIFTLLFFSCLSFAGEHSLKEARALLDEGKPAEAAEVLRQILAQTSEPKMMAELQGAIGWALVQAREYAQAETYLEQSLSNATQAGYADIRLRANNNLGISYYLQNRFDESRAYFNQDFAQNSPTAKTYLKLLEIKETEFLGEEAILAGVDSRHNKEFEQAIDKYDLALKYIPGNVRALEYKGYAQFRLGRLEDAYQTLQLARQADPEHRFTYLNLLKVSCALESPERVKQVIEESPFDVEVYREWEVVDGELRSVCENNTAFTETIGRG